MVVDRRNGTRSKSLSFGFQSGGGVLVPHVVQAALQICGFCFLVVLDDRVAMFMTLAIVVVKLVVGG